MRLLMLHFTQTMHLFSGRRRRKAIYVTFIHISYCLFKCSQKFTAQSWTLPESFKDLKIAKLLVVTRDLPDGFFFAFPLDATYSSLFFCLDVSMIVNYCCPFSWRQDDFD